MSGLSLDELLMLDWGWDGPREVTDDDESVYWEMRISELPDFFVAGDTHDEVLDELKPALRSFLQSFLDNDEIPSLPEGKRRWVFYQPHLPHKKGTIATSTPNYRPVLT